MQYKTFTSYYTRHKINFCLILQFLLLKKKIYANANIRLFVINNYICKSYYKKYYIKHTTDKQQLFHHNDNNYYKNKHAKTRGSLYFIIIIIS